ncbi:MAG: prolipoprotein diacylglyceryl transferase [Ardenticatenaceae bacterium]|nr:prolipoprotein diacylglyceryl transferase [Anaerolineales bacterium]MCB8922801.1 prolipoprotein diacylglyceryl transferase [Ardenticatenaceae bacterium]MCB8991934.1 prolipoprotein diacylglyceryl transferase [Ardenticatenaceae bacterium]MCB9004744.1 prolipoprotein diacylglyceryl transferase [Ardenticatenaceae bacterium]
MFPTLHIGPLSLPTAGVMYILGAYAALTAIERAAGYLRQDAGRLYNLAGLSLLAGFVGARLTFVVIYWPAFRNDLLGIVWPLNSGYDLMGGLVVALVAGFFYGRFHQLNPWPTLDALVPGVLVGLLAVSLADFLGGPGFGELTNMPWGITQFSVRRHPVQIYEILAALLALGSWWYLHQDRLFDGQLFLLSTALYSGGRLITDAFRENAWLSANGIHLLQVICLALMLLSLYLLTQRAETVNSKQ